MYDIFGCELPLQDAGLRVGGIDIAIATSEINFAVRDCGGRGKDVPGIWNGLRGGRISVKVLGLELSLVLDCQHPLDLAGCDVNCAEAARRRNEIEQPSCNRW